MSLNSKPDTSYAYRNRVAHSKAMYAGDYTTNPPSKNPVSCNTNGQCRANLYTSPKYQYGTRLFDLRIGQQNCCNNTCNCIGCLKQ